MGTIIWDTETTGLIKPDANELDKQPYITEIYLHELETGRSLHRYTKPPVPLSAEITRITGITNDFMTDKPSFAECYQDIADFFVGCDTMVAHNLAFDRSMLANELLRIGKVLNFPWPPRHVCTVEMSMWIEQRRINLTKLHEYATGKPKIENAHTAGGDVAALTVSYEWLLEEHDQPSIDDGI